MSTSIWETPGTLAAKFWNEGRADIPICDMHGHMGTHNGIYMKRSDPESMARHLRRIGVKHLVFSHHHVVFGTMRNAEVVEICRRYPELYRMYVGIIPRYPEFVREDLAEFDKWTPYAVGLKCLADYYKIPLTDPAWEYALKFADERALPVLFHTWGGSKYNGGEIILKLVQTYPRIKFFLGHSLYGEWDMAERIVKESNGNVWLELTAIPGEYRRIEKLVAAVGSDRLLYGTDLPWFDEYQAVGGVLSAEISEDDMRNILYRNADGIMGKNW
jgi:hypothetical protein